MQAQTARNFAVTPPPAWAWGLLIGLGGVFPLAIIAVLWLSGQRAQLSGVPAALVAIPVVLAFLLLAMQRRSVELRDGMLDIRATLYRKRISPAELDLQRARIVNLGERTELRPLLKTNGFSAPGLQAGHFRLRGGFEKAFCLLTDRRRVLWLPLRDGKNQLLLSLEQPQALLDALR